MATTTAEKKNKTKQNKTKKHRQLTVKYMFKANNVSLFSKPLHRLRDRRDLAQEPLPYREVALPIRIG